MGMLLLDRQELDVRCEGETLALYESGERKGTVPIKLVDRCVIQGSRTRLDSGVLTRLAEAGATTLLMSRRYPRRVALVLGPMHKDAATRLAQCARVMDLAWCDVWSAHLMRAKLVRQARALRHWQTHRPDARKALTDALDGVTSTLAKLGDGSAPMASLRGFEGAAARAYFGGLAAVVPPALGFAGRNRRPPRDPVNACLSLGYTLAHAQAVQACVVAGLDPLLGFYHRPSFGRESLASDLIEPLRPSIDEWVWGLLRERALRSDHFSTDSGGACLLGKAGRQVFYASWEKAHKPWTRWLRLTARKLARNLHQEGVEWMAETEEEA